MDVDSLTVVDFIKKNMRYQAVRERVASENIANATTPGYLPKQVVEPDFKKAMEVSEQAQLPLARTNPKHLTAENITSKNRQENGFQIVTPKPTSPLTIDGNGVVLEDELNQANKASGEYNRMITIYNKYRDMLKNANTKINI